MPQPRTGRAWHLASRPVGRPRPEDFALRELPVAEPADGEVTVRNLHLSVDPYMRGRMSDVKSYVAPYAVDAPMDGGAVGEVIASRAPDRPEGTLVVHHLGWREYATLPARHTTVIPADAGGDPSGGNDISPSAHLGVLGMPGLTAWAGLLEVGGLRPGDAVFVSGAAGAVGGLVGRIARLKGASRVVGSAGTPEKIRLLTEEYGFDAAFDYHDGPIRDRLREAAPEGIDLYFDNVGGEHLEAAIGALRVHGRAVICGMISQYNATEPPAAPRNLAQVIGKRLRLEGMLVNDHNASRPRFLEEMTGWLRSGEIDNRETVVHGIDNAARAFLDLLDGGNTGKMIVTLDS
ncbi:zinc-binding dehydrogenase [Streptomyces alkaliphilus]|uniref:Zinc-binding dehydrogenase n=1 Tax=Streptomyces alkaliphilus TaxID=1472722 RepID=A0A7W3Y0H3_9ACTN|nr:NADP-dependent oxidoreductase [Streptomyces alkaliphilus]MBB0243267.1 zinc-binding dehydrogenase [Streptomyces alkaliphilus]